MELGFGAALLIIGSLLAVAAALSGVMRGTILSISVLSVTAGIALAATDVIAIDFDDAGVVELIELALVLTLIADGLVVDRSSSPATGGRRRGRCDRDADHPGAAGARREAPVRRPELGGGVPARRGALADRPGGHLDGGHGAAGPSADPSHAQPRVGLNDGLALPFVLFFLVLATPGGDAGGEAAELLGEAVFGALVGIVLGIAGGYVHRVVPLGVTPRFEGIYAVGFGLAAFGLADVTFGNGGFVAGITLGYFQHKFAERLVDFSENVSAIFQVLTFFVFGAIIVATTYDGSPWALVVFIAFALLVARPISVLVALAGTKLPRPQKAFIAWFGPKGVASMLFALLVLDEGLAHGSLVFEVAAFVILGSILAHGLTDTVGARWIERRMRRA